MPTAHAWPLAAALVLSALSTADTRAQSPSPEARAVPQEQFSCQLPGTADRRQIGIYRPGGLQRCRVDYTRDGKTRSLWSAGHDYQFCVRKALEIIGLLENVNFKCAPHSS
jgi:hypothetical protein